jgi:hypothetical protein
VYCLETETIDMHGLFRQRPGMCTVYLETETGDVHAYLETETRHACSLFRDSDQGYASIYTVVRDRNHGRPHRT